MNAIFELMRLSRPVVLLVAIIACRAFCGWAQISPCRDRTVPVNIFDEHGGVVTGLTAANFRASMGRTALSITDASYDMGPRGIALLVDVSGSMTTRSSLFPSAEFARDFVASAIPQDSIALLTFSGKLLDSVPFGTDRSTLLEEIQKLQDTPWGKTPGPRRTALYDALAAALALFRPQQIGDAICLVSDGGENASTLSGAHIQRLLESSGAKLYAFGPREPEGRGRSAESSGPADIQRWAQASGGDWVIFDSDELGYYRYEGPVRGRLLDSDREKISRVAKSFYGEISSFERVTLRPPEPLAKPAKWKLEVVDSTGASMKHVQVVYPHYLVPCANENAP